MDLNSVVTLGVGVIGASLVMAVAVFAYKRQRYGAGAALVAAAP